MGLARRIKFRYKFTKKYVTDVYGFLNKKTVTKEINKLKLKIIGTLLKSEKGHLLKRLYNLVSHLKFRWQWKKNTYKFSKFRFVQMFVQTKKYMSSLYCKNISRFMYDIQITDASDFSWLITDIIKYVMVFPFLKVDVVGKFFSLWKFILNVVTRPVGSFLRKGSLLFEDERKVDDSFKVFKEFKNFKVSNFFLDKTKSFVPKIKSPRLFSFFYRRMRLKFNKYMMRKRKRETDFRLDRIYRRRPYVKRTMKTKMYRLLKVVRRYYGNLRPKKFWNLRRIAYNKSIGYAWFNYVLIYESRFDHFLVRSRLFDTHEEAKSFIRQGWLMVNGVIINNYRFIVNFRDFVSISISSKTLSRFYLIRKMFFASKKTFERVSKLYPDYLEMNYDELEVTYIPRLFDLSKIISYYKLYRTPVMNWGKYGY